VATRAAPEHAVVESWFATLKDELLFGHPLPTTIVEGF
jgi:hypothetical protein